MSESLRWTKFETIMIAILPVNGISASKFNRFQKNHLSFLENSDCNVPLTVEHG